MKEFKNDEKIHPSKNELLLEITEELHRVVKYIELNLMNVQDKEIDYDEKEKQGKKKIKLGVKRKNPMKLEDHELNKDKDSINLNEDEGKNDNSKDKKLKEILYKIKRHSKEIVNRVGDVLKEINSHKNKNNDEEHVLNHNVGNYIRIRKSLYGFRDGITIVYFKDGNRYEGDIKNNKRDGKGIYYYNNGERYEGDWKNDKKD